MLRIRWEIWGWIWKLTPERNRTNATNATMYRFTQQIWRNFWKLTLKRNPTNAVNATMHLRFEETFEKSLKIEILQMHPMWLWSRSGSLFGDTFKKSGENATNPTIAILYMLKRHRITHTRHTSQKCNQCNLTTALWKRSVVGSKKKRPLCVLFVQNVKQKMNKAIKTVDETGH